MCFTSFPSASRVIGALFYIQLTLLTAMPFHLNANDSIALGKKAGEVREFASTLKIKFCWCPAGSFRMGTEQIQNSIFGDETPVEVTLSKGFWMGQTEVTQRQWVDLMGTSPWTTNRSAAFSPGVKTGDDYPAVFISHGLDIKEKLTPNTATDFCLKLTQREKSAGNLPEGWSYMLPTEAQWEYACRAGSRTMFCFGDDYKQLNDYAWFGALTQGGSSWKEEYAHQVATKKPNSWNIYDMHGNTWEWCREPFSKKLLGGTDPIAKESVLGERAHRGGCWGVGAAMNRSGIRAGVTPDYISCTMGFRIALVHE